MKTIHASIFVFFGLILFASCANPDKNSAPAKPETPKALQDGGELTSSYKRGYDNYVNELYQELVEKRADLKKLEADLDESNKQAVAAQSGFNDYDSKSKKYYSDADRALSGLSDSLLRKRIEAIVEQSRQSYDSKVSNLSSLLKQSVSQSGTLQDYHQVLKVALTLPMIEQYQNANLPDKKDLENSNLQQRKLIQQMDSLSFKNE